VPNQFATVKNKNEAGLEGTVLLIRSFAIKKTIAAGTFYLWWKK